MIDQSLTADDRRQLWLYFLNLRIPFALTFLLTGLILAETGAGKASLLLAICWLSAAAFLGTKRPADLEIDSYVARDVKSLVRKALDSLDSRGAAVRGEPFVVLGPAEPGLSFDDPLVRPREGFDGVLRSPVNRALVLVPVEDHLWIYSCRLDSLSGQASNVAVEEHHFRDVVTVRLEEMGGGKILTLELTNGRRLTVPASAAWKSRGVAGTNEVSLDETLLGIQAFMRDKR